MEYIVLILLIGFFSSGLFFFSKKEQPEKQDISISNSSAPPNLDIYEKKDATIKFESLPDNIIIDTSTLLEIKDSSVLSHIDNLIPGLIQASTTANIVNQATTQTLYQAIIPASAKLSNSRDMSNALRGFYFGENGIKGHANLVAADQSNVVIQSTFLSSMNVASIIVGQYYMSRIDSELKKIANSVSEITAFQNNEYNSKVSVLIDKIQHMISFQSEILDNPNIRNSKIIQLNSLEEKCEELLKQAGLSLKKSMLLDIQDYTSYESELTKMHNWYLYQKNLLNTLLEILNLEFTFNSGYPSIEYYFSTYSKYLNEVRETQQYLKEWHHAVQKHLEIEIESKRIKRTGLDGIIHRFPGLFNDAQNYRSIPHNIVSLIQSQTTEYSPDFNIPFTDLFAEDVRLISKDGKLYYLPPSGLS